MFAKDPLEMFLTDIKVAITGINNYYEQDIEYQYNVYYNNNV